MLNARENPGAVGAAAGVNLKNRDGRNLTPAPTKKQDPAGTVASHIFTVALLRNGQDLRPVVRVLRNGAERWRFADRPTPRLSAMLDAAGWLRHLADEIEHVVFDEMTFAGRECAPPFEVVGMEDANGC